MSYMTSATVKGGEGVRFARLLALRGAVHLEGLGMKRRGRSATAIVKQEFGIKGNRDKVLAFLDSEIARMKAERGIT